MTAEAYIESHPTLEGLEPYLVIAPHNRLGIDYSPYGLKIEERNRIDPTHSSSERFCDLLLKLDSITFGPEGMPMDKWVFYDICYMPGSVLGFGLRSSSAPKVLRELFQVSDREDVLIPLSMYGAIPMAKQGAWMGHNLCSIGKRVSFRDFRGLGTLSKVLGLRAVKAQTFYGATQWSSVALNVHAKFGPLRLYTAFTPAHSESHTLTYGFTCNDKALLSAAGHPEYSFERPTPELWVSPANEQLMMALQDRLESGEKFCIPTAPRHSTGQMHEVPIASEYDERLFT